MIQMTAATDLPKPAAATAARESADSRRRHTFGSPFVDERELRLFRSLDDDGDGVICPGALWDSLSAAGLKSDDIRLADVRRRMSGYAATDVISFVEFSEAIRPNILLIEQALQGSLAVPDFAEFCAEIRRIFNEVRELRDGRVADYIPQLGRVDPERFAVGICTVDGQQFAVGDSQEDFCVQSCSKPITYCLALEQHGADLVHQHLGREPSGRIFNEVALGPDGKPHNPMINAGAIMCSALVGAGRNSGDRFDDVLERWTALCGGRKARFNNAVYQSERQTADRNFALGYLMQEQRVFPEGTDLLETLDFFFQCCSIEANAEMLGIVAATLANGGVCPVTGERIFSRRHVQHCLSLMCSCGMYDFSGEFAFVVGLPAKSGVGGAVLVVIPNLLGFCVWSPRLDAHGNSVRGVEFCRRLVETFNVHNFDTQTLESDRIDPRADSIAATAARIGEVIRAASNGDLGAVHRLLARGCDPNDADYDRRTPIHLAAAEGRTHIVQYLIEHGADINPYDRWGGTPLDDARRHGHDDVADLLLRHAGVQGLISIDSELPVDGPDNAAGHDSGAIIEAIYAASQGNLAVLRRLVARGVDLNGADYDSRTPLHLAAAEGRDAVVRYFIDQGLDLSPRDRWGNTPLDDARRHGREPVVELLI